MTLMPRLDVGGELDLELFLHESALPSSIAFVRNRRPTHPTWPSANHFFWLDAGQDGQPFDPSVVSNVVRH